MYCAAHSTNFSRLHDRLGAQIAEAGLCLLTLRIGAWSLPVNASFNMLTKGRNLWYNGHSADQHSGNRFTLREVKLMHIFRPKSSPASWALAQSAVQVSLYAGAAEHVHALGNDDILLPLMTNIAAEKGSEAFQLILCLL